MGQMDRAATKVDGHSVFVWADLAQSEKKRQMWRTAKAKRALKAGKPATKRMIRVERHIPLPTGPGRRLSYPFAEMQVGNSFAIPLTGTKFTQPVLIAASRYARKTGKKFTSHTDKESGTVRVWRIS